MNINNKIGLDARWSIGKYRGMGRFTRFFIKPIEKKILAFANKGQSDEDLRIIVKGINFYPFWEQITLPYLCKIHNIDILISPYNTAPIWGLGQTKLILIIHDIIFMKKVSELPLSKSTYQNLGRIYRRIVLPLVIYKAKYLITVSEYSKLEIIKRFNINENRIIVLPNTIDENLFNYPIKSLHERKPYIFCISGEGPSKNLSNGIKGFINLIKFDKTIIHNLIIVGVKPEEKGNFHKIIEEEISNRIIFLDFISNESIIQHYQNAHLFFFPSLYEGFGIPLIEAMALGTPIACSNTSCFPEVTGNAALHFNPQNIQSISDALSKLIKNSELFNTLQKRGLIQVRKYHPNLFDKQVKKIWELIDV